MTLLCTTLQNKYCVPAENPEINLRPSCFVFLITIVS